MGTSRRPRPARLATKLLQIRTGLGVTQAEMFERLGDTGTRLYVGHIDDYEKDRRVPTLQVVLAYARAARIPMELIVDDALSWHSTKSLLTISPRSSKPHLTK